VRRRRGFVLVIVVFFAALLISAITTFLHRSTLDAAIVRNRDQAARAEALARGGVRLAHALLLQDLLEEGQTGLALETPFDVWRLISGVPIETEDGSTLSLEIEDAASRLDVNALVQEGQPVAGADVFLADFLAKIVEEMPGRPEDKLYEPDELAEALLDYLDADDVTKRGELEDDWYQQQDPPARAANRPLLSVDELAVVRGFDRPLVEAIRPYVTVFPYTGGAGPNPNTAPSWVLASLYLGPATDRRLASEDQVRRFLNLRTDAPLCPDHEECVALTDAGVDGSLLDFTLRSQIFLVHSRATVGGVSRVIDAAIDRSQGDPPRILAWRVH
jgi:general secretion pathway protein K